MTDNNYNGDNYTQFRKEMRKKTRMSEERFNERNDFIYFLKKIFGVYRRKNASISGSFEQK